MGFTVSNYSFLGLQKQNWYVTIKGSYQVRKIESLMPGDNSAGLNLPGLVTPYYTITFSVYFKASPNSQVINNQYMSFNIQALPNPAVLYKIVYDYVKGQLRSAGGELDPYYMSNQQLRSDGVETLIFTDD
jgi:hypothetical protein